MLLLDVDDGDELLLLLLLEENPYDTGLPEVDPEVVQMSESKIGLDDVFDDDERGGGGGGTRCLETKNLIELFSDEPGPVLVT